RLISQEVGRNNYQGEIIAEKSQQTVSYLRDIQAILNQIINLSNQQKNSFLSEMEKEINQVSDSIKKPF
ncbi:MAG: methyl-accepting chemotaxis protein, partial [Microcystis panniformis]